MRRLNRTKRRLCMVAFTLLAAPLLVASVASACTQLKNLSAEPGSGPAGATVRVTGTNYVTTAGTGPVEIRLDHRSSAPIATLPVSSIVNPGGVISFDVTIPASAANGYHTLLATQHTTDGVLLNGFPVRASYEVTAAAGGKESPAAPSQATVLEQPATETVTTPAAPAGGPAVASAVGSTNAMPAGASAAAAGSVAAPVAAATGAASGAGSNGASLAATAPAAPGGPGGPPGAAPSGVAASAVETSTPALAGSDTSTSAVATGGLLPAAGHTPTSAVPELILAFGAALVLLSLVASLRSGRSVLSGRRTGTLA